MKRVSPTASTASSTRLAASPLPSFLCRSGSVTLPRTDFHGSSEREYSWKTSAIASGGRVTRSPRSSTEPSLGASRPDMHFSSVVLPQPEGPTTQTNSFSSIANEIEPIACVASPPSPYVLPSCLTSSIVSSSAQCARPGAAVPGQHAALDEVEDQVQRVPEQP